MGRKSHKTAGRSAVFVMARTIKEAPPKNPVMPVMMGSADILSVLTKGLQKISTVKKWRRKALWVVRPVTGQTTKAASAGYPVMSVMRADRAHIQWAGWTSLLRIIMALP